MERQLETSGALEHDDQRRKAGIGRLAVHVAFDHLMHQSDEGKFDREEAFDRIRALRPHLLGEATE